MMRHINDDLVRMDQIPPRPFTSLNRNQPIVDAGGYTQMDWYAMYPHMYVGDAHRATGAKGEKLFAYRINLLVKLIRAVKDDDVAPALVAEFNERQANPTPPAFWSEEKRV